MAVNFGQKFRQSSDYLYDVLIRDLLDYAKDQLAYGKTLDTNITNLLAADVALDGRLDALEAIAPVYGTWTPTVTFATPGNLNVVYITQMGRYIKIGKQVTVWFGFATSTFTHTTAAGGLQIMGLPFASANIGSTMQWSGAIEIGPMTLPANYTWVNSNIQNNSSFIRAVASGGAGGVSRAACGVTNFLSGTNITIYGSISYETTA